MESQNQFTNIQSALIELPEEKLSEVMDFINFIKTRHSKSDERKTSKKNSVRKIKNPIKNFIGCIESGSLSAAIDDELYCKAK